MKTCPECGTDYPHATIRCFCGRFLPVEPVVRTNPELEARTRRWLILISVVVLSALEFLTSHTL